MKAILRGYGLGMSTLQRQQARTQAGDMIRTRGTNRVPGKPRDIFTQAGPRGVLLNWRLPDGFSDDVAGFRVYKDDETKLFAEVNDPHTTQYFAETTAGATPPVTNFFVSSINQLGVESPKVPIQSAALVEAGAPVMPVTPPTYTKPDTDRPGQRQDQQP